MAPTPSVRQFCMIEQLVPETFVWPQLRWLDSDSVLLIDRIDKDDKELAAEEAVHAAGMTAGRRREFAAGRRVARQALATLGEPSIGIPMRPGGEPLWPEGISGSLSHTTTHAAALVTKRTRYASVGVDLDDSRPIGDAAAAQLMTNEEIEVVIAQGWAPNGRAAQNVAFSAKEALFKCQYPLTGNRELDFDEVRLVASDRPTALAARCVSGDSELESILANIFLFHDEIQGLRLCWALLQSRGPHGMFDFRTFDR